MPAYCPPGYYPGDGAYFPYGYVCGSENTPTYCAVGHIKGTNPILPAGYLPEANAYYPAGYLPAQYGGESSSGNSTAIIIATVSIVSSIVSYFMYWKLKLNKIDAFFYQILCTISYQELYSLKKLASVL